MAGGYIVSPNYASGGQWSYGDNPAGGRTMRWDPVTKRYVTTASGRPNLTPIAYGGGAGGAINPFQAYLDSVAQAEAEAKAANEARYAEGKSGYFDRWKRNVDALDTMSNQGEADLRSTGAKAGAQMHQDLVSRGFGGSAALPSMKAGLKRQTQESVNRWRDSQVQQRIDTDARLSGDYLGFIERRVDSYPDLNAMTNLAQAFGYGNGGGGYSVSSRGGGYGTTPGVYRGTRYGGTGGRVRGGGSLAAMPWQPGPRAQLVPRTY